MFFFNKKPLELLKSKTFTAENCPNLGFRRIRLLKHALERSGLCPLVNSRGKLFAPGLRLQGGRAGRRSVFLSAGLPNAVATASLHEHPAGGRLCRGPYRSSWEAMCFWCYQEGFITPRESIQNDSNGTGSHTAVQPYDKESLKYPLFIMPFSL